MMPFWLIVHMADSGVVCLAGRLWAVRDQRGEELVLGP
eukprot:CAMPEP_0179044474 /NCGR_PEP_ID=MMETSP0796-20121207/17690_1 /TAXON_ID=73915 /ORGANISM="Pyrodinium bahamense, Strain pbaha01" /LENGTH=37 /DNA_ID= /DNA_START= /DNA_END= /DNA_ORIENTATION=